MVRRHLGSALALAFGALTVFSAFSPLGLKPDNIIAGLSIIVGALAYRSCKKRKLRELRDTTLRLAVELWGMLLIVLSVVLRSDLKEALILKPVTTFIIPALVLLAYAIASFSKSTAVTLEKKL